jgi:hypothetical protein
MPMSKHPIGTDEEGKTVNVIWGADLNWAHGMVESNGVKREYYRAQGKGNAHYAVVRETNQKEFAYWYVVMLIDGKTINLPTECMNAYEGQEICQIFESERDAHIHKEERARIREDKKLTNNSDGE